MGTDRQKMAQELQQQLEALRWEYPVISIIRVINQSGEPPAISGPSGRSLSGEPPVIKGREPPVISAISVKPL